MKTAIILCRRAFVLAVLSLLLFVQPGFAEEFLTLGQSSAHRASSDKPLETLVKADGTLDLTTGFSGNLDAKGWKMVTDAGGQPRFVRSTQKTEDVSASAPGDQYWDNSFVGPPGVDGSVFAIAVTGSNVYVGGSFALAGAVGANNIAQWHGTTRKWSALGTGVNGSVNAIAVGGGEVYVGGSFTMAGGVKANNIAKWNGVRWSALRGGVTGCSGTGCSPYVSAIAAAGTIVYVGGNFTKAGGTNANNIAKWNGSTWSALRGGVGSWSGSGSGVSGCSYICVQALAVSGTDLYVGGYFSKAGKVRANGVAKWDGMTGGWSALGEGVTLSGGANGAVYAIALRGSDIYVGGAFAKAGSVDAKNIAKWNGNRWSSVGRGTDYWVVHAIAVSARDLYAGGEFITAGGITENGVAKWDGSSWSSLGSGISSRVGWPPKYVHAVRLAGSKIFVGGDFEMAGDIVAGGIALWNGSQWSSVGTGTNNGVTGNIETVARDGSDVYVGGSFLAAGVGRTNNIARWDGNGWSALGSGTSLCLSHIVPCAPTVYAIAPGGGKIFAGGNFLRVGGVPVQSIAEWDGKSWSDPGGGVDGNIVGATPVYAIAVSGSDVYVGGYFLTAGNIDANFIAKWDGSSWSALGSGVNDSVAAIAVSGKDVYVGGRFTQAGGNPANHIAKWDSAASSWSALGAGTGGDVQAIAVSGSDVYVGGSFTTAGGTPANRIAKWNVLTDSWSALGSGVAGGRYPYVSTIVVSGSNVYVGGGFNESGGVSANNIAVWDGQNWSGLGSGVNGAVSALAVGQNAIYVGGAFTQAGGKPSYHFARWFAP